jgi:bacterioferritin-associated ferredoxin
MLCHCLQITEEMLHDALVSLNLATLNDVRQATGAGDGCTACHHRIKSVLETHRRYALAQCASSSPI